MGFEDDPKDERQQFPCECSGNLEHNDIGICPHCFNESCDAQCLNCGMKMCFWRCDTCDIAK
jgi:hypothetical protein